MNKLLQRIIIFLIPIVIIFSLPALVLILGEEITYNNDAYYRENYIWGLAYSNPTDEFKFRRMADLQPEVLALGSSRMAQFCGYFVRPEYKFYCASNMVSKTSDLRKVFAKYKKPYPKLIVLGVDHWWFNAAYYTLPPKEQEIAQGIGDINVHPLLVLRNECFNIWKDYLIYKKFRIRDLWQRKYKGARVIGVSAKVKYFGFVKDGSFLYSNEVAARRVKEYKQPDFQKIIAPMIEDEFKMFVHGDNTSARAFHDLEKFLVFCRQNNIEVVGFLTPFPGEVYAKLIDSKKYTYLNGLNNELAGIFKKNKFSYYDFTVMDKYGIKDDQFIDVNHGSETVYLRLWQAILEQDRELSKFGDLLQVKKLYNKRYSPLEIAKNKFID